MVSDRALKSYMIIPFDKTLIFFATKVRVIYQGQGQYNKKIHVSKTLPVSVGN